MDLQGGRAKYKGSQGGGGEMTETGDRWLKSLVFQWTRGTVDWRLETEYG